VAATDESSVAEAAGVGGSVSEVVSFSVGSMCAAAGGESGSSLLLKQAR